jgi:hypothetical protein
MPSGLIGKFLGECKIHRIKLDYYLKEEVSFHFVGLSFYLVGVFIKKVVKTLCITLAL